MNLKNTVFLPKTDFSMKASLAVREPDFLDYWKEIDLYQKIRTQSKGRKKFILHFGPPYANGHIHIGHALSETLKDVINKTYQMKGYDAPMVPGWDCHGLPIEWKVEEGYRASGMNKDDVPILEFREECRAFADKWIPLQSQEFQRLGIIADWKNPYITMDYAAEARTVEQLGKFLMNGSLYRGLKPVMWSVVEKTALAEAEVEYKDHTSDSIYVSFPIVKTSQAALKDVHAIIWTTTPWTLPGNRALAFGQDYDYEVILNKESGKKYLLAQELRTNVCTTIGWDSIEIVAVIKGTELAGAIAHHPLHGKGYDFDVPLIHGDHVTTETGTGLVHTAPGHGVEDFEVGKVNGIEIAQPVGPDGIYYNHVPLFAGLHVYKANPSVMAALTEAGHLLHAGKIVHSYPHSWRSKAPLIFRATSQWFISMENTSLRHNALKAIDTVEWYPAQGKNRIKSMVEGRPDWCISRQRAWGTPMTLFVHKQTGEVLCDPEVHARIVEAIHQEGGDAWFSSPAERFLGDKYDANDYEQVRDILDVWFDSGCSHEFVLKDREELSWPADLYLEGSDQHRGWFQSSLLESCGTDGTAPYRKVLTHGFVLDEKGYKMSKSLGNVIAPNEVIDKLGADLLRLWIVSADYSDDMRIGKEILKQQEDIYRRLRNTLRYLLGALDGYSQAEAIDFADMPELEQWIFHKLAELQELHDRSLQAFDLTSFYYALHNFCASDLSAFYFDIRKDCLYCDPITSPRRKATRMAMHHIFEHLVHWLAPVLSFTAEEAFLTRHGKTGDSIHLKQFPTIGDKWANPELGAKWDKLRHCRRVMTGALEVERAAKTIGSSLQAHVTIFATAAMADFLNQFDMAEVGITSTATITIAQPPAQAFILEDVTDIGVVVSAAEGDKCVRCWRVLPEVSRHEHSLCMRCDEAITA
ncbi:MAG: isoleucine--tRNA ligase [Candidatus Paracaedibacteraceae bacterium]|nr:isoleucine--tRNA ligase [Candidatus Paracaedibacteraceae bacterium]